jgi:hypothetical protein
MTRRRLAAIFTAALLLGAPRAALPQGAPRPPAPQGAPRGSAAPSQEPKAAAQALFDEAMALRKKGSSAEACAKLGESLRLDPAPGTKFYLAECLEQSGKLASAWLLYVEVADAMAASGQQKREVFARERSAALFPKLARLEIVVPAAARVPGLVVRRDGVPLGEAQWGFAVPVDFGKHTVEVTAPNQRPFTKTVDVHEAGATETIDVPRPTPMADGPPAASVPPTGGALSPIFGAPLAKAGLAAGGIGVVGLALGGALGALAISKQNASNRGPCDLARDVCSREGLSLRADAITAAAGSTIAFVAGGVMLAAGVVLVVLPAVRPARATADNLSPVTIALRPGGLSLEGRW